MKKAPAVDLEALPGHHIRRLQQIAVAIFLQETEATGITPVQYAALQAVANTPGNRPAHARWHASASTPRPSPAWSTGCRRAG